MDARSLPALLGGCAGRSHPAGLGARRSRTPETPKPQPGAARHGVSFSHGIVLSTHLPPACIGSPPRSICQPPMKCRGGSAADHRPPREGRHVVLEPASPATPPPRSACDGCACRSCHRDGRDAEQPAVGDWIAGTSGYRGWARCRQVGRRLPARARHLPSGMPRLSPGPGRSASLRPASRRGRLRSAVEVRSTPDQQGRVQHPPLRLPRQRRRPAAEVRRRGARYAYGHTVSGVHRRPRRRGRGPPRRDDRPARRGVADPRHRHGPGTCTCEGAASSTSSTSTEFRQAGPRRAPAHHLTNEAGSVTSASAA